MPTIECMIGELRGKVEAIENNLVERQEHVDEQFIVLNSKIDKLIADDHKAAGAMWMFTKIGMLTMSGFGAIGWFVFNNFTQIRALFKTTFGDG